VNHQRRELAKEVICLLSLVSDKNNQLFDF